MAVAITLGSMAFGIAKLAINLTIGGIAGDHGVEWAMALAAVVAGLMPFLNRKKL